MCFIKYFFTKQHQISCPVCYTNESLMAVLNCGHVICFSCALTINRVNASYNRNCPICRYTINSLLDIGFLQSSKCLKCYKKNPLIKCKNCNKIICIRCYIHKNMCDSCNENNFTKIYID